MAIEVIDPKLELDVIICLNDHVVTFASGCIFYMASFLFFHFIFMCMSACLQLYMCPTCVSGVHIVKKRSHGSRLKEGCEK